MNKKNIVLGAILALVVVGISIRLLMNAQYSHSINDIETHTGVDSCLPSIVDYIAVDDGIILSQGKGIMYTMDTKREIITQLDTNTKEFDRHFYSDTLTFNVPGVGVEKMILKWIDGNSAAFEFIFTNEEKITTSCIIQVKGQWAMKEKMQQIEFQAAAIQ